MQPVSIMQNYSNPKLVYCFIHSPPLASVKAVYDFTLKPLGFNIMGVCVWVCVRACMRACVCTLKPSSLSRPQSWDLKRRRGRRRTGKSSSYLPLRWLLSAYETGKPLVLPNQTGHFASIRKTLVNNRRVWIPCSLVSNSRTETHTKLDSSCIIYIHFHVEYGSLEWLHFLQK